MNTVNDTEKIIWINAARGLGIILMLVGHSNCPDIVNTLIFGFHIPFFFILSGYLYNDEKWKKIRFIDVIKKRAKSLIIPYFVFSLINLIINIPIEILGGITGKNLLKSSLSHLFWIFYSYGDASRMPNSTPLWYLPTLFLSYIFLYLILKNKSKLKTLLFIAISILINLLLNYYLIDQIPWHIDIAMLGTIFMLFGIKMNEKKLLNKRTIVCIISLIIGIISISLNTQIDLNNRVFGNVILMFCGAIGISYSILFIFKNYQIENRLLCCFGENTVLVLAFNRAINKYTWLIWKNIPIIKDLEYQWWIISIIDILCFIIIFYIWNIFTNKYPRLKILTGKDKKT